VRGQGRKEKRYEFTRIKRREGKRKNKIRVKGDGREGKKG
jgi:hypothetical protein